MKKRILKRTLIFFLCSFSIAFFTEVAAQENNKKSVRIDIGHGGLHCPFLSVKFEDKLKNLNGCENFFLDKKNSFSTFVLPNDTLFSDENLKKMVKQVGYPENDIVVKSEKF